jgi:transcriptional regulator with XRE-family HTH domain
MRGSQIITEAFAEALYTARTAAGLTQEELAHRSGLDRSTVSQSELGKASPQVETLIRLAGGLGMDPSDLLPKARWKPPAASARPKGEFREE